MSDSQDRGGINGQKGYTYQAVLALYYLIVKESRELEWECNGEDFTVINEESSFKSINFIQAKHHDTGAFTLAEFKNNVLPQFWKAFSKGISENPEKFIGCTLITDIAQNHELKVFSDACKKRKESGISSKIFAQLVHSIQSKYQAMQKGKDHEDFWRFTYGLSIIDKFSAKQVQLEIVAYLKECGINQPRAKLLQMLQYITEKDQTIITRREIEGIAGKTLSPIKDGKLTSEYSRSDISNSLSELITVKNKFGTTSVMLDTDILYREITKPIIDMTNILGSLIENNSNSSITQRARDDYLSITISDRQNVVEEAEKMVKLEKELWFCKTRLTQKISSIEKTHAVFDKGDD